MKNSNQNQTKSKKENQLIFVEYQRPTQDGHLVTVTDSYRNSIGKIMRSYNEQSKKYEFVALDHSGKPMAEKTEKLGELKHMYLVFSKELLEQAHQRRIESKQNALNAGENKLKQNPDAKKVDDKKVEAEKTRPATPPNEKSSKAEPRDREEKNQVTMEETEQAIREHELDSIRDRELDQEDRSMER